MPNPYGAPEVSVQETAAKLAAKEDVIILDVRERNEIERVALPSEQVIILPLSQLARQGAEALPEELRDPSREVIVMCHHGVRSAQVTTWLRHQGWTAVRSLAGGIDAYAREVDPSIGTY